MSNELHIRLHEDVVISPHDVLDGFPLEENQRIISFVGGVIVVDLAGADDTTYLQDWFLNNNDAVYSYFIVEE